MEEKSRKSELKNKAVSLAKSDSSVLMLGTVLSQLIPLALQPFLRRIYDPADFGNFALYFSLYSIGAFLSTLNYHSAITLPKEKEKAQQLISGILFISLLVSTFIFILLLIAKLIFSVDIFSLGSIIWFLPISILLNAVHLSFTKWLTREREFKMLSVNKITRRIGEGAGQFSLHKLGSGFGLVYGSLIGDGVNVAVYLKRFKSLGGSLKWKGNEIKTVLKRYKNFPIQTLIPNLLNTVATYLPIFLITGLFTKEVTGHFDLSRMVLAMPLALVAASFSSVLLQRYSVLKNDHKSFYSTTKRYFFPLLTISILAVITIHFFGPNLFEFVFGSKNKEAGKLASIMVFSYAFTFIASPFSSVFIATEKLMINSVWQVTRFLMLASLYLFEFENYINFIFALTIVESINYLSYAVLVGLVIKKYEKSRNA